MKKALALLLALVMLLGLGACTGTSKPTDATDVTDASDVTDNVSAGIAKEDLKIGFIHISDPSDMGYTYNHDLGTIKMVETLGLSEDQIINKYNIGEDESCTTAINELIEAGCNIIFGTSFGFGPFLLEAAEEHPEIQFCHATGSGAADSNLSNFHNYFVNIYEARYLAGIAAGMKMQEMIDNGTITADKAVIGYVAAFYFEEIISGFTAFYLGAKSVCPSATMQTLKVDSWSNPSQEAQVAQTLIDGGCVVISQHSDNTTPATTAEANGVYHCGYNADMSAAAPNASLVSARADWSIYLIYAVNCVINGEPIATDWSKGLAEGAVFLSPLNTAIAAPGTQEAIDTATQKIISGDIHVFDGPISGYNVFNAEDTIDIPAGEHVDESVTRSAPYFAYIIDGITLLDA